MVKLNKKLKIVKQTGNISTNERQEYEKYLIKLNRRKKNYGYLSKGMILTTAGLMGGTALVTLTTDKSPSIPIVLACGTFYLSLKFFEFQSTTETEINNLDERVLLKK